MAETGKLKFTQRGPILHIDDDAIFRAQLKELLEERGLRVIPLDGGAHAIRFLQTQPWNWYPWVIITDIILAGIGGYQMMQRIQEYYPKRHIPTIVITNLTNAADVNEAEIAGASAYLSKSSPTEDIIYAIERVGARQAKQKSMLISLPEIRANFPRHK